MTFVRYALVFLAVALGVAIAVRYLSSATTTTIGSAAQLMVPAMIAAVVEGMVFARSEHRKPTRTEAWRFTYVATLIAVVLNIGLAFLATDITPEFGKLAIARVLSSQFSILLLIYAFGYLLCNRFFIAIGATSHLNTMRSKGVIK